MNMRFLIQILFCVALSALGPALHAADPREQLIETVDAALEAVYGECCKDLPREEQRAKVLKIIESNYDFNVIIRRAIGRNWNRMDADEQETVVGLIKKLVVKAYVDGLEGNGRPKVDFGETVEVTDNRIEIPSTVETDEQRVKVLYRMGRLKSGWQIFDIVAEDISVVSNYRQQFDDHFRKGTVDELIRKLEELLKKEDIDEDIQL